MPLNPVLESLLADMAASQAPSIDQMSPAEAREMYRAMQNVQQVIELPRVRDVSVPGPGGELALRIYYPNPKTAGPPPVVLFFHGGGWVIGDLESHDHVCRALARGTSAAVIAVDYRLAPEAGFPAALQDSYAALEWVAAESSSLEVDASRLAVAGDSAGGNLATCTAIAARDKKGPQVCAQLLIYPVTDTSMDYPSYAENGEGYLLTRAGMEYFLNHYLSPGQEKDPRVAPMRAASLSGLPPALIITAEFDPLRDEGEAYGKRLEKEGTAAKTTRYDGMIHGFFNMAELLPEAKDATDEACDFLKERLQKA